MEILKEKNLSLSEVRNMLDKIRKEYFERDEELSYEQKRALNHARKYEKTFGIGIKVD